MSERGTALPVIHGVSATQRLTVKLMQKLKLLAFTFVASALSATVQAQPVDLKLDYLTGLPKLACEAILCLSSGTRPSECTPSLNHYFSIEIFRKGVLDWSATVDARRVFLNMCPAGNAPGMSGLINALSRGGGRCDAAYLNATHRRTAVRVRRTMGFGDAGEIIHKEEVAAVNDQLPLYCQVYYNHEWTRDLGAKYVGTPCTGGRWVEAKDYESELLKWRAEWETRTKPRNNSPWNTNSNQSDCSWADASDLAQFNN